MLRRSFGHILLYIYPRRNIPEQSLSDRLPQMDVVQNALPLLSSLPPVFSLSLVCLCLASICAESRNGFEDTLLFWAPNDKQGVDALALSSTGATIEFDEYGKGLWLKCNQHRLNGIFMPFWTFL